MENNIKGILFDNFSPPSPNKLHELTHRSYSEFIRALINNLIYFQFDIFDIFKKFLYLFTSVSQSLIYSLLTLSGFQTNSLSYDEINIFRYLLSSYKMIFALFINLPGLFIIFIEGIKAIFILRKESIGYLTNPKNIYSVLTISAMLYTLTLLFTVGHIRYLLPIFPILLIGSKTFWDRLFISEK